MKNLSNVAFFIILSILITGCYSSSEEVWINPDGSGRMEMVSDMSDMYPFIAMGISGAKEKLANGDDSEGIPFMDLMLAEEMDTTFLLKDLMKEAAEKEDITWEQMLDSIRHAPIEEGEESLSVEERESMVNLFESMMEMEMRWQVSQNDRMMKATQIQKFASLNELKEKSGGMMEAFKKLGELGGEKDNEEDQKMIGMFDELSNAVTELSLADNILTIKRSGMDLSVLGEENEQIMSMMKMFMKDNYQIIVHFPGKVKSFSSDIAQLIDKKSIMIEFPLEQIFDPELNIDVLVEFKGLEK